MPNSLAELRVLVVEDEYLIASDLTKALKAEGAFVIGPAATLAQGRALCRNIRDLDCAVLDINLRGESVFPLADELQQAHVPFLFSSGYGRGAIPPRFANIPLYQKPVEPASLLRAVRKWLQPQTRHAAAKP